uniref:Uncharacterized protein n=1 Tax=Cannabis sativa TaxID=3483 RepID=A0A803PGT5_CANSA
MLSFLHQKSKVQWLKDGDENTAIFHASIRTRRAANRIYSITDMEGHWTDQPKEVSKAFLNYYNDLLGTKMERRIPVIPSIIKQGQIITEQHKQMLMVEITPAEVKQVIFAIPKDKSPALDDFGSIFFHDN